jgi:hypothetical protein
LRRTVSAQEDRLAAGDDPERPPATVCFQVSETAH